MSLQLGSHGPLVSRWTQVMLWRFSGYAFGVDGQKLRDDGYFGYDEEKVQREYERRTGQIQDGVVSDQDLAALGLTQPIIFTIEGHMSNMWFGPCADNARQLQVEGVAYWQPVGYESNDLPFDNRSGRDMLADLWSKTTLPNNVPFPYGTHIGGVAFSQGAMVWSEFLMQDVLPENGRCHRRLPDIKRSLCLGNPRRDFDKNAPWVSNPAKPGTQGIMDRLFVTDGTVLQDVHRESAHRGDMFAENTRDEMGLNKTAIAKIITENSWIGGDAAIFARLIKIIGSVPTEAVPLIMSIISAVKFAASNPNPHYGTVAEPGDLAWMRGVAA